MVPRGLTIAAGEAVGDVLTLGLAEVLFIPIEGGTRNAEQTASGYAPPGPEKKAKRTAIEAMRISAANRRQR
jgi:hypothetical protein